MPTDAKPRIAWLIDARNYGHASLAKLMAATQVFELRDKRAASDEVAH